MLKRILPARSSHVLYANHTRGSGTELFRLACQLDLEGIVAKRSDSPYEEHPAHPHWTKIKNPAYSQKEGRGTSSSEPDNLGVDSRTKPAIQPRRDGVSTHSPFFSVLFRLQEDHEQAFDN